MDTTHLRYIVFLLNTDVTQYLSDGRRIDTHDGKIFCDFNEAKKYAESEIEDKTCTRFAIGFFVLDSQAEIMSITCIETFGFRNDKKNTNQLSLFNQT